MRQRTERRLTDDVDIYRREQTGENEIGEPILDWTQVAAIPCRFDDESTEFVRSESGGRVRTPAAVTVFGDVDVEQGDRLLVNAAGWYEATGADRTRDHRRGVVVETTITVQETDAPSDVGA